MRIAFQFLLGLFVLPLVCRAQDLTLVRDGHSPFTIVVSASASPSERRGASDLQTHLKRMSGAELRIIADDQPLPEHAILIGHTRHTDGLHPDVDVKSLGTEGFALQSRNGH